MSLRTLFSTLAVALMFGISSLSADIVINEIRVDQSGADDDEYFELYADGMSFADLSIYTYIVIGDGSGGSGTIESVTTLDAVSLSSGGFFLVAEDADTFGQSADQLATLGFENSDNVTHLLVEGFTGSNGDDLDTNDDGTLDTTPWTSIVDSIALIETVGSGDLVYSSTQLGPNGSFVPAHAYRDVDGTAGTWQIGEFDPTLGNDTPGFSNAQIPEPASAGLLGMAALAGLVLVRRRK